MCSRKSDAPLRTCKRGVIAMYTGAGGVGVHQNSMFYIAFNGLPKMDDRGMVYGEIIEGCVNYLKICYRCILARTVCNAIGF